MGGDDFLLEITGDEVLQILGGSPRRTQLPVDQHELVRRTGRAEHHVVEPEVAVDQRHRPGPERFEILVVFFAEAHRTARNHRVEVACELLLEGRQALEMPGLEVLVKRVSAAREP